MVGMKQLQKRNTFFAMMQQGQIFHLNYTFIKVQYPSPAPADFTDKLSTLQVWAAIQDRCSGGMVYIVIIGNGLPEK